MVAHQVDGKICLKLKCMGFNDTFGFEWDDGGGYVKQIFIWHGDYISGFQIIYEKNNTIHISQRHGGDNGDLQVIYPERPLTWMNGSFKFGYHIISYEDKEKEVCVPTIVSSLKFGDGRKTYGPFGVETGYPFKFKCKDGIFGFHGISCCFEHFCYISAIGPYIKTKAVAFLENHKGHTEVENFCMKLPCFGFRNTEDHFEWDDGGGGHLKQILIIWNIGWISGFQTIYERNNTILVSQRHGGDDGDIKIIDLKGPLTWMSGHFSPETYDYSHNNVITSLKFGNKEMTYGPFGDEVGQPFLFKGKDEIVGFHGWTSGGNPSYRHISAIGPYVKIKKNMHIKAMKVVYSI